MWQGNYRSQQPTAVGSQSVTSLQWYSNSQHAACAVALVLLLFANNMQNPLTYIRPADVCGFIDFDEA